jgi:hypothetical protein
MPLDPTNDNDPVAMGTNTRALICAALYIVLLCCTAMLYSREQGLEFN